MDEMARRRGSPVARPEAPGTAIAMALFCSLALLAFPPPQAAAQTATTTVVTSGANTSTFGQAVTFTAAVTAGATGTVAFSEGATPFCSAVTVRGGLASCRISGLAGGAHTITATYGGDANFAGSSGSLAHEVVRAPSATTVVLSAGTNPSAYGQPLSFTATVTRGATGTVAFADGPTVYCAAAALRSGTASCRVENLGGGSRTLTATYGGDGNYVGSTGTVVQEVSRVAQTITVVQSAPASAVYLDTFTVGATASSGLGVVITASGACSGGGTGTATVAMSGGDTACTVTYAQPGDGNYLAAAPVTESTAMPGADLTLSIDDAPDPVGAGGTLRLVYTVGNNGPSARVSGVHLLPQLAQQLVSPRYSLDGGATWLAIAWTIPLPELALGGLREVLVEGEVPQDFAGYLTAAGSLLSPVVDANGLNEGEVETTLVQPQADLSVAVGDGPDPAAIGQDVTYVFGFRNEGPTGVADARVVFQTAADASRQSSSAPCTDGGAGLFTLSLGAVSPGGGATATLVLRYASSGVKGWSATAASSAVDLDPTDDVAAGETVLDGLLLAVTVSPEGGGRVTGAGIDCPGDCDETIGTLGQSVVLTASPAAGYQFVEWTGDASGGGGAVTVTMDRARQVTAWFNSPPTLDPLAPLTVGEDAGVQTVALTGISAGAGESQTLRVTASSSNPALVPDPTVAYASPGAAGSLSLAPAADASGTATITVTVDDGQAVNNTVARSFTVTVGPVNDAPTLDPIADLRLGENAGVQAVGLAGISAGGGESQVLRLTAVSSNPAVIPNPAVAYVSPGATGSLSITPVPNASGTAAITVTVSDGQALNGTFARVFTVTVSMGVENDFNADGSPDILWREAGGGLAVWLMTGAQMVSGEYLTPDWAPTNWTVKGTGDFNLDGSPDILWQEREGALGVWYLNGLQMAGTEYLTPSWVPANWAIKGTADFNADGFTDILWQEAGGTLGLWYLNGSRMVASEYLTPAWVPLSWAVRGTGDFNADGHPDLLWQDADGTLAVWYLDGSRMTGSEYVTPSLLPPNWEVAGVGDFDRDGGPDILLREAGGTLWVWYMDGPRMRGNGYLTPNMVTTNWEIVGAGGGK